MADDQERREASSRDLERLESLINAVGGVVYEFDWASNVFGFVSDAAESLLGFPKQDWFEPGFWEQRLHPNDQAWAAEYCIAETREGRDHELEYRLIRADGSIVWVRDIASADAEKCLEGRSRGLLVDITARKLAEERLASTDRRFKEVAESVGLLAVELDAAGTVVYANEPAKRLFGESIVGRLYHTQLTGEAQANAMRAFESRVGTGAETRGTEIPVTCADGMIHVVRWHSANSVGPNGEFAGVMSLGEDITERAAYERTLALKAEEFDAIFRLSGDLFFRFDPGGTVVGYSAPNTSALYAPPSVFMGKHWSEVLPPHIVKVLEAGAAECHRTHDVAVFEYSLPLSGEDHQWEARFLPVEGGDTAVIVRDVTARNRRDAELRESEARYRTLVDLAPDAIYVVGLDDVVLYCNDAAAVLLGAGNAAELAGRSISATLPVDYVTEAKADEDRVAAAIAQASPGDPTPVSKTMRATTATLDGRVIDIERTIAGIFYKGRPALLVVARDITDELESQRAIAESRDFLANLLEMLDSGVIVVDGRRRVIKRANRPVELLFGYERDEMLGMSTRQMHPTQESWEAFNAAMADGLRAGELRASEFELMRRDGTVFDAEVAVRSLSGPGGDRLGVLRDITERKTAERAVRESEHRFRAIVDSAPFGLHLYRLDGEVLTFMGSNQAAAKILGVDLSERVGLPIEEVFPGLGGTDIPDIYRSIAREGGLWQSEEIDYDAEGIKGAYEVAAFQIQPGQMAAAFTDITERKSAELRERSYLKKLSALTAELASAEDAERRHLAEELHDRVSQALAVAMMHFGTVEAANGRDRELAEGRRLLERAISETRTITTELYPPVLHELGLGPALHWLCDQTERDHEIRCDRSIDESAAAKLTTEDRTVLFRSARELLMNVVKHSHAEEVEVSLRGLGHAAELAVEDRGVGFDVDTVTAGGSSGFGLFSIRERLFHLGGEVEIESVPGGGTRVAIRMPYSAGR